uniref:Peptidase C14 caspase domain-containing protein n=1 Tax=Hanusia phi TaxID=3032 RepID=A0A7S0EWY7_9CRYP|mmetsp:Transcript_33430/g.74990  ORF Transcript_33430/g.74990 Transcript_33430/m.74990 type:complete len:393 (+) Transcript_33430:30-1208(+)
MDCFGCCPKALQAEAEKVAANEAQNAMSNASKAAPNTQNTMGAGGGNSILSQALNSAGGMQGIMSMVQSLSSGQMPSPPSINNPTEFKQKAAQALPSEVHMFSGCRDEQTSADVYDTSSFGLPADSGPGGAGGACTNSIMLALTENPNPTWIELLNRMRTILKEKGFTQVPQLSSSKEVAMDSTFQLAAASSSTKALLIGINYVGQQGELRGCHNDVLQMKDYIAKNGYDPASMRVLMDDGSNMVPNRANILDSIKWLVKDAKSGDCLFMHYSGHGGSMKDDNGDEADGMDETMVPVDYASAGQIRDDLIFQELVAPLPQGVKLIVIMDCCHSGTILDLPFSFKANDQNTQNYTNGMTLPMNGNFNWQKIFALGMSMLKKYAAGTSGMSATV